MGQLGAMPPIAELQARWFGAILCGNAELPMLEEMDVQIASDRQRYESKVYSERLRFTVDFVDYTSDVARLAGCYPSVGLMKLFTDFALWRAFWFGPVLPQAYRIDDGGARAAVARKRLVELYRT